LLLASARTVTRPRAGLGRPRCAGLGAATLRRAAGGRPGEQD